MPFTSQRFLRSVVALVLAIGPLAVSAQAPRKLTPGEVAEGLYQLPSGWRTRPAGKQVPLPASPMAAKVSPDGRYVAVLSADAAGSTLLLLHPTDLREMARVAVPGTWIGLAINKAGDRIYVGGGVQPAVFEFAYENQQLRQARQFDLSGSGGQTSNLFVGDVALSADEKRLYVARLHRNGIDVVDVGSGAVVTRFGTGRRPYRILPHPQGNFVYISSWADGSIYRHRAENGAMVDRIPVGAHTTDMVFVPGRMEPEETDDPNKPLPFVARIFVTAGNTNSAYVVGVEESGALTLHESINLSLSLNHPMGATPTALAYNEETKQLLIACADLNAVAVADVRTTHSHMLGFVPVGWYPVSVVLPTKNRVATLNLRGSRSYPSSPERRIEGSASMLPLPSSEEMEAHTRTVLATARYRDALLVNAGVPQGNPIPPAPGLPSPIKHVIYVVKGGHSYDAVFGNQSNGNTFANHRKVAREFGLFDNFYAIGDGPVDGLYWSTGAIAPDYVQRLWPQGQALSTNAAYPAVDVASLPPGGFLWTQASLAGLSLRNYGFFARDPNASSAGAQNAGLPDPVLEKATHPSYPSLESSSSDLDRVRVFLEDLKNFETQGTLPQLLLVRLQGSTGSKESAEMGDRSLGLLVEGITKSKFWPQVALFVVEANAEGADAVDSHRSPVFIVSPYAVRNAIDSNFYNTASVLRTIELILGLRPMTQFDAGSSPMWTAFQETPDLRPYTAETSAR